MTPRYIELAVRDVEKTMLKLHQQKIPANRYRDMINKVTGFDYIRASVVITEAAKYFDICPDKIRTPLKAGKYAYAKHIIRFILAEITGLKLYEIGEMTGTRSMPCIRNSREKVLHDVKMYKDVAIDAEMIYVQSIDALTKIGIKGVTDRTVYFTELKERQQRKTRQQSPKESR